MPLTAKAAERLAREAACQAFEQAAKALSIDWPVELAGKQVQRWGEALGQCLCQQQQEAVEAMARGILPVPPENAPELLVVGMDGGRYQSREQNPDTLSRWKEDKIASFISYRPGDGKERPPEPLVASYLATTAGAEALGPQVKHEALARGSARAKVVLNISDGAAWIDTIEQQQRLADVRIVDFYHAAEHIHEAVEAALGKGTPEAQSGFVQKRQWLLEGKLEPLLAWMKSEQVRLEADQPEQAQCLGRQIGYLEGHREQMDYPVYRARGWPIGSGGTESAVKQFNKRVKGTEQFWNPGQLETILGLRALWLATDDRWRRYWASRSAYRQAA